MNKPTPAVTTTTTVAASPAAPAMKELRVRPTDNAFPWRRFAICIVGIIILLFVWRWSVNHLYTLPATSVSVFGSITTGTMYAITFIVAYFITGRVYFTNWSMTGASTIATEVKSYIESKKGDKGQESKDDKKGNGK